MNRYRLLRFERGMTQQEVADKCGISRFTMIRLENAQNTSVSAPVAKRLAEVYGMTVAELLGVTEQAA